MISNDFNVLYDIVKKQQQGTLEEMVHCIWSTYYIPGSQFQYEVHEDLKSGTITIYYEKRIGDDLIPYEILDNKGFHQVFRVEE